MEPSKSPVRRPRAPSGRLAVCLVLGSQCQWSEPCPGTAPFGGETAVPADVVLEIRYASLPRDLPSVDALVRLTDADGRDVPIAVLVDLDTATVFVTPEEPLAEGEYTLVGIDWQDLPHWTRPWTWAWDTPGTARIGFAVGGTPHLVGAGLHDADTVVVGFSEAVDASTVEGALDLGVPYTSEGPLNGDPRLIALTVEDADAVTGVTTLDGLTTPDGRAVRAGDTTYVDWSAEALTSTYAGRYQPTCGL